MSTEELLKDVPLRFSTDTQKGFTRKLNGDTFSYFNTEGKKITDEKTIERIQKLAIPPAYKRVWICPYPNGHLQATGFDARGRKQYRYHALWNQISQEEKFSHLLEFASHLPKIRKRVRSDFRLKGMPRQKVLAAVVWLLENTLIRIGNEEYAQENKSYGLTTLKNRHVNIGRRHKIKLSFKGKSGVYHNVTFKNKKIAEVIRRCRDLPGQDLFEYRDDEGQIQTVTSQDVNSYLQEITNAEVTAKDFRTWGGTILAASVLDKNGLSEKEEVVKKTITETVKRVASHLRNKPDTCRKYYIHPSILDAYSKGYILSNLTHIRKRPHRRIKGLDDYENKVVSLLKHMIPGGK